MTINIWKSHKLPRRIKVGTQRGICTHSVHSNTYTSQKVEATQMTIDGGMNKWNVVYIYNWISSAPTKEESSNTCYNTRWNLKTLYPVKYTSNKRTKIQYDSTYEVPRVVKFIGSPKIEWWLPRCLGWEKQEYCLMSANLQFWAMKKFWNGWWWWLLTNVWVYAPHAELYTSKVKMVNFMLFVFTTLPKRLKW